MLQSMGLQRVRQNLVPEKHVLNLFHVLGPVLNILCRFKHLILKTALYCTVIHFILEMRKLKLKGGANSPRVTN